MVSAAGSRGSLVGDSDPAARTVVTARRPVRIGGIGEVGGLHPEYGDCATVGYFTRSPYTWGLMLVMAALSLPVILDLADCIANAITFISHFDFGYEIQDSRDSPLLPTYE